MDTNNEILDAIEILADKKIGDNITKVLTGICTSVNINKNTCVMNSNGVSGTVYFYGSPPEVNGLYRIFVPSNDMSRSFIIVPPRFTVNPNLLDNWYFANPVNQRGQTSYTAVGYTVDRWNLYTDGGSTTISTGYLDIYSTKQYGAYLAQKIDPELAKALAGKTVTYSVLAADGDTAFSANINKSGAYLDSFTIEPNAVSCKTWTFPTDSTDVVFNFAGNAAGHVRPIAAKLELGPAQTLAHLENGSWVLNEIPDYGGQLARCQRYYINSAKFGVGEAAAQRSQIWPIKSTSMHYCAGAQFPVIMRTTPAVTIYSAVNGTKNAISNALNGADSPAIASAAFVGSNGFHQITLQGEDSTLDQSVACYTYIASADL